MVESRGARPITATQVIGVLALTVIVFFIFAFASKAVRTYRLRVWRDDLKTEIAAMELERQGLLLEIQRRESRAWIDEALKETGRVPPGVTSVRLISPEGSPELTQDTDVRSASGPTITQRVQSLSYFDNPNWSAWMQLLISRD
ncbi:MAG: hypothetical protein ACYCYF_09785 [Anaerolineae bacterium]